MTKTPQQRINEAHDKTWADFKKKYPNADYSKFHTVVDGDADGNIKYAIMVYNDGKRNYDVNGQFLNNADLARYLDLWKWRKGKRIMEDFKKRYPSADMSKFKIYSYYEAPDKDPKIFFKHDNKYIDLNSNEFKNNKEWVKILGSEKKIWPKIWNVGGSVPKFFNLMTLPRDKYAKPPYPFFQKKPRLHFYLHNFRVYVNENEYFDANLQRIPWREWSKKAILYKSYWNNIVVSKDTPTDVRTAPLDYVNELYFTLICAAYAATFLCGISWEHLQNDSSTPKIIKSMARFHLYYTMRKFIKFPKLMDKYNFEGMRNHQPALYQYFIKNSKGETKLGWVSYSGDDYLRMIPYNSNGLTNIGLGLLQSSVETYVYCVLGAQAKVRHTIVGRTGSAIQAQDQFRKLVEDTIIVNNYATTSSNMRIAIKSTNVVLNLAISPGIILIPSSLVILTKPITGYNNILKTPNETTTFGFNKHVNYQGKKNEEAKNTRQPNAATDHLQTDPNVNTSTPTREEEEIIEKIENVGKKEHTTKHVKKLKDIIKEKERKKGRPLTTAERKKLVNDYYDFTVAGNNPNSLGENLEDAGNTSSTAEPDNAQLEEIEKLEEEIPDIVKHRKEINAILKDREKKKGTPLSSLEKIEIRQNYWKKELKNHLNKASGGSVYTHPYGDNIITLALIGGLSTAAVYHIYRTV